MAIGRRTTGQRDQIGFLCPIQAASAHALDGLGHNGFLYTCSQGFAPPSDRQGRRTTPSAAESAVFRPPFHSLRSAVPCEVTQVVLAADRQLPRQQGQERLPGVETSRQAPALLLLPVKTPNETPTLQSRA